MIYTYQSVGYISSFHFVFKLRLAEAVFDCLPQGYVLIFFIYVYVQCKCFCTLSGNNVSTVRLCAFLQRTSKYRLSHCRMASQLSDQ